MEALPSPSPSRLGDTDPTEGVLSPWMWVPILLAVLLPALLISFRTRAQLISLWERCTETYETPLRRIELTRRAAVSPAASVSASPSRSAPLAARAPARWTRPDPTIRRMTSCQRARPCSRLDGAGSRACSPT